MRKINNTINWTKKDTINSRSAISLQDTGDAFQFTAIGLALIETDETRDNETKNVTCFKTEDGNYYSTISEYIYRMTDDIIECLDEEGKVTLRVGTRTSKQGREFLVLNIL